MYHVIVTGVRYRLRHGVYAVVAFICFQTYLNMFPLESCTCSAWQWKPDIRHQFRQYIPSLPQSRGENGRSDADSMCVLIITHLSSESFHSPSYIRSSPNVLSIFRYCIILIDHDYNVGRSLRAFKPASAVQAAKSARSNDTTRSCNIST